MSGLSSLLLRYILVLSCLFVAAQSAALYKNSAEKEDECPGRQPCGWMVYNKSTRNIEFFMNNTCICSEGKKCLQTDDDLSVGAYVYRCIEKTEANPPLMPS